MGRESEHEQDKLKKSEDASYDYHSNLARPQWFLDEASLQLPLDYHVLGTLCPFIVPFILARWADGVLGSWTETTDEGPFCTDAAEPKPPYNDGIDVTVSKMLL